MSVTITPSEMDITQTGTDNVTKVLIKKLLSSAGLSMTKAIKMVNELHPDDTTTPQNISNKLTRDSISFTEVSRIAEVCGYQVVFKPIGTPEAEATPAKSAPHTLPKVKDPEEDKPVKAEPAAKKKEDDFVSYAAQGYAACKSTNFYSIVVAGKEAVKAAQWIESNIDPEMTAANELVVILAANRQFDVIAKPIGQVDSQFTIF